MAKKKSGLFAGAKRQNEKLRSPEVAEVVENIKVVDYKSTFDFVKYEIEDIKESLVVCEEAVVFHNAKSNEHKFKMAEALHTANNELASRGNGIYVAWCDNLGITRNKSADMINAYNLYLETNNTKALELPVRVVRGLNKEKDKISSDQILKVVEADKPSETFEEVKKSLLHSATFSQKKKNGETEVIEAEIIESREEKKARLLSELKFKLRDKRERENNLRKLNKEIKTLEQELENYGNLQIEDMEEKKQG